MAKNCSYCGKRLTFRDSFVWDKTPVCRACLNNLEQDQNVKTEKDYNFKEDSAIHNIPLTEIMKIGDQKYKTIKIGNQLWMAENLKVTHYRNGDAILNVTDDDEWKELEDGAYCSHMNAETNAETYGYLYNWYAIDDARNIAPEGWHVPTDEEWKELEMYLSMSQSDADDTGDRGTNQGSKLAGRVDLWNEGDLENNASFGESGFSALPGGCRYDDGSFENLGSYATFWSCTQGNSYGALYRELSCSNSEVYRDDILEKSGFSVRLIRD